MKSQCLWKEKRFVRFFLRESCGEARSGPALGPLRELATCVPTPGLEKNCLTTPGAELGEVFAAVGSVCTPSVIGSS